MELKHFFRMTGDEENSYAHYSHFARKVLATSKPYLVEAIEDLLQDVLPLKLLRAADLGCSFGPNATFVAATIIDTVKEIHRKKDSEPPEIQYLLNDLPSNDFNSLFIALPSFSQQQVAERQEGELPFYVMGVPGSFYGRVFPKNDIHFVHSSYSIHWLSQAPEELNEGEGVNKGNIYISKTSPPCVWKAYLNQFEKDFCSFLKCRSEEMVANGRMVLIIQGRPKPDPSLVVDGYHNPWPLITQALSELVSQGRVEKKKIDEWNVPYYAPSREEVKNIVEKEGSFVIQKLVPLDLNIAETEIDVPVKAEQRSREVRSFTEMFITHQFGKGIIEDVYERLHQLVLEEFALGGTRVSSFLAVLKKEVTNFN